MKQLEKQKKTLKETTVKKEKTWHPVCEDCCVKKCVKTIDDARNCETFVPKKEWGVWTTKNKQNELVFLKNVGGVIYASEKKSDSPILSFQLKDWHRTSTRKLLKNVAKLKETDSAKILAKISIDYQMIQKLRQEIRQSVEEEDNSLTPYLLVPPLTTEEIEKYRKKAEEWLKNPKLLSLIIKTLDERIVGERRNKTLSFLSAHSTLLPSDVVLQVLSAGESALGKNWMETHLLRLFPRVLDLTGITPKALDWAQVDLTGWIIYIRELLGAGSETASLSLRVLMTEGGLKLFVPIKDAKTGKFKTTVIQTKGTPSVHSTVSVADIDEQLLTRVIDYMPDDSTKQTEKIVLYQGDCFATIFKEPFTENEMVVRCINELMTPIQVVIPYGKKFAKLFPVDKVRARRDHLKLGGIIMAIASLYRKQRLKVKKPNGEKVVLSNLDDLDYAMHIGWTILAKTMIGVPKPVQNFYKKLKTIYAKSVYFTKYDASKTTGYAVNTCRMYLSILFKNGYLDSKKIEGTKRAYEYAIGTEITIPKLKEEINKETFFTRDDFKQFLKEKCNIQTKEAQINAWYTRWQGSGSFDISEILEPVKVELEDENQ